VAFFASAGVLASSISFVCEHYSLAVVLVLSLRFATDRIAPWPCSRLVSSSRLASRHVQHAAPFPCASCCRPPSFPSHRLHV
jgi:hypothetical protein